MLAAFARAFRTPDLRKKLLFTLGIIALYRLGSHVPTPGVDYSWCRMSRCQRRAGPTRAGSSAWPTSSAAVRCSSCRSSRWASCRTSRRASSCSCSPWSSRGSRPSRRRASRARRKLTQYTRYLTIGLAILQSADARHLRAQPVAALFGPARATSILTDHVHGHDPHHGPHDDRRHRPDHVVRRAHHRPRHRQRHVAADLHVDRRRLPRLAVGDPAEQGLRAPSSASPRVGFFVIAAVVFVEQSQRRIPVQYAKRMVGRRMYGGTSTYIPLKVNMAGVIPVIFASSLLSLPAPRRAVQHARRRRRARPGSRGSRRTSSEGDHPLYMRVYFALILFFTFFYVVDHVQPRPRSPTT